MDAQQFQQFMEAQGRGATLPKLSKLSSSDPGDYRVWKSNFQAHAVAAAWNAQTLRNMLKLSMEGEAHRQTRGIDLDIGRAIADIWADFDRRFLPPRASAAARMSFKAARQLPSETLLQWQARLRELYVQAHPGREPDIDTDWDMIEAFTDGIHNSQVRVWTRNLGHNTLTAVVEAAQTMEQSVVKEGFLSGGGRLNQIGDGPGGRVQTMGPPGGCFTCGGNHYARDCPKRAIGAPGAAGAPRGRGRGQFRGKGRGRGGQRGRGPKGRGSHKAGNSSAGINNIQESEEQELDWLGDMAKACSNLKVDSATAPDESPDSEN